MARFEPFRGARYDTAAVHLDQVIAPPYDVISATERRRLALRHPANAVRVELPEADLAAGSDRYAEAARLLGEWQARGILRRDDRPAFYPYRMTPVTGHPTLGVVGALGLTGTVPGDQGDVLPHEMTLPKPRSDRLDLLRATGANLSPIWGLSLARDLSAAIPAAGRPTLSAHDDDGVLHEMWVTDDPAATGALHEAVAGAPVVIADGHHRWETALAYRAERRAAGLPPGADDLVMALVVELSDEQLHVGAIHRTVSGLPEGTDLMAAFTRWFDVVRAGPADTRTLGALADPPTLALVTAGDAWLLTPRPEVAEAVDFDLDAAFVSVALDSLPPHRVEHRHTWQEAVATIPAGEAQAAILLRPPSVAQITRWAEEGRRTPPKTTYFSPKPRTGMVFRLLEG